MAIRALLVLLFVNLIQISSLIYRFTIHYNDFPYEDSKSFDWTIVSNSTASFFVKCLLFFTSSIFSVGGSNLIISLENTTWSDILRSSMIEMTTGIGFYHQSSIIDIIMTTEEIIASIMVFCLIIKMFWFDLQRASRLTQGQSAVRNPNRTDDYTDPELSMQPQPSEV